MRANAAIQPEVDKVTAAQVRELARSQAEMIRELLSANEKLRALIFGRRSERYPFDDHPQLPFVDEPPEPPAPPNVDDTPDEESDHVEHKTKKTQRSRGAKRLPQDLPRERVLLELAPGDRKCACCGLEMVAVSEEKTEILDYDPARFRIVEIVRPKYVCKDHEESGVCVAPMPARPIPKGMASSGLIAHVIAAKYDDHLPLYRQSRIFRSSGVELDENTLGDWIKGSAQLLAPIADAIRLELLKSHVLHADETTIRVLAPGENKTKSRRGYLWVYHEAGGNTLLRYTPGRGEEGPVRELRGFHGHLMIDGYEGYNAAIRQGGIVPLACWAHVRRGFHDARNDDPEICKIAIEAIRELYAIERKATERGLSAEERLNLRSKEAAPLIEGFHEWLQSVKDRNLPGGAVSQAIHYALNRWDKLKKYLHDGRLPIDNNAAERTMKHVAVGRKNWLFAGSEAGAERAATLYSLVLTCRNFGINAREYLESALQQMAEDPARAAELTPRAWKARKDSTANSPKD
jgi:transposase